MEYHLPDLTEDELYAFTKECERNGSLRKFAIAIKGEANSYRRRSCLLFDHWELWEAVKAAAEEQEEAEARKRGIRVIKRPHRDPFTGDRLPFHRVFPTLRVRHRGPRQRRAAPARVRGSRRSVSRSFSRGGDSGDDSDGESEPERGRPHLTRRPRR